MCILTIILTFFIFFESYTQYFSSNELARNAEKISQIAKLSDNAEIDIQLKEIQEELLNDFTEIQQRKNNPGTTLLSILLDFFKGAWPIFFTMWFILKKLKGAFVGKKISFENFEEKTIQFWFGLQGFSGLAWSATILGFISILWNKSDSLLISWFIFPLLSLFIFISIIAWALLLKTIIPKSTKDA